MYLFQPSCSMFHSLRNDCGHYRSLYRPLFTNPPQHAPVPKFTMRALPLFPSTITSTRPFKHIKSPSCDLGTVTISTGGPSAAPVTPPSLPGERYGERQKAEEVQCLHFKRLTCFHSWRPCQKMSCLRVESRLQMVRETGKHFKCSNEMC